MVRCDAEAILKEVSTIGSMAQALRWALNRSPPGAFVGAVAQDEFTHDVIVRLSSRAYVVFDTT